MVELKLFCSRKGHTIWEIRTFKSPQDYNSTLLNGEKKSSLINGRLEAKESTNVNILSRVVTKFQQYHTVYTGS